MPRLTKSDQFLAGFITARQSDLQEMLNELASPKFLTENEMHNMRGRIDQIDANVRRQHRDIESPRLRPKLTFYEQVLELALSELTRRERHRGHLPPESDAMRARRLRSNQDLDPYASDGQGEVPLECWTCVNPAPRPAPSNVRDLRERLNDRREGREKVWWSREQPTSSEQSRYDRQHLERQVQCPPETSRPSGGGSDGAGPSGLQRVNSAVRSPSPRRMETDDSSVSAMSRSIRDISPTSARSRSSIASYVSVQQTAFSEPQTGVPLPPRRDSLPCELNRTDRDLIGRSEIYVRSQVSDGSCAYCGDQHRMYRCPAFGALGLRERWYQALSGGVCLNCLRLGHSSFTCLRPGACKRCGVRHNSLLCTLNRANRWERS